MGLLDKIFGKNVTKYTPNQTQVKTKKERYIELVGTGEQNESGVVKKGRYTPGEAIALIDREEKERTYEYELYREHKPQYQIRPKYQPTQRYPPEQRPQKREKSFWDKFADASVNVKKNIERESFGMGGGGNFGGGFGEIDLMRASGFGKSRQEKQHHKKQKQSHKKQQKQQKSEGKSITINL